MLDSAFPASADVAGGDAPDAPSSEDRRDRRAERGSDASWHIPSDAGGGRLLGSPQHLRALAVYEPALRGRWRLYRRRYFDRFRFTKLRWIARQRRFLPRAWNFLMYLAQRDHASRVAYSPPVVNLELVNVCNLRCPGCTTGRSSPGARPRGKAPASAVKERIDWIAPRALQLQLFQLGEPLLHAEFFDVCRHAARRGLWTVVHSNLSLHVERLAERLVDSRLCQLVVSCDGATQETYGIYRVRGDVEQVFRNLGSIAAERRRRRRWHPWLTAKFIVFDHNWHEMEAFRDRALAAGADDVLFIPGFRNGVYETGRICSEVQFDLRTLTWKPRELELGCRQLWEALSIDVDGAVLPCCDAYRDEDVFVDGEVAKSDPAVAWNHPRFRAVRAHLSGQARDRSGSLPKPCDTCRRTLPGR